jgi:hypothetical protein
MGLLGKRRGKVAKGAGQPAASGSDAIGGSLSKDDHFSLQEAFGVLTGTPPPPPGPAITATGGTKVTSPTYITHFFTSPGNFIISSGSGNVDYLMVAGGGSGGGGAARGGPPTAAPSPGDVVASGGGGAGGLLSSFPEGPGGPSPTSASSVPLADGTYAVVVGAGCIGGPTSPGPHMGQPGSDSSIAFPSPPPVAVIGEGKAIELSDPG